MTKRQFATIQKFGRLSQFEIELKHVSLNNAISLKVSASMLARSHIRELDNYVDAVSFHSMRFQGLQRGVRDMTRR